MSWYLKPNDMSWLFLCSIGEQTTFASQQELSTNDWVNEWMNVNMQLKPQWDVNDVQKAYDLILCSSNHG